MINVSELQKIKIKIQVDQVKIDKIDQILALIPRQRRH